MTEISSSELTRLSVALTEHPFCRSYVAKTMSAKNGVEGANLVRSAEDVLGERLARLANLGIVIAQKPESLLGPLGPAATSDPKSGRRFAAYLIANGLEASPYLWTENVRTGLRELKLPAHVISPAILPGPRLWFTLEASVGTPTVEGWEFWADCFLIIDDGKGLSITAFGAADGGGPMALLGAKVEWGTPWLDSEPYCESFQGELPLIGSILVMCAFLNSPHIPKSRLPLSRARRRDCVRAGIDPPTQEVGFVILRRPSSTRGDKEAERVEWKHRWLVNGHIRNQWYPSERAHKPVWIAPYVKGPEDAPFKVAAYKVAQ